VVGHTLRNGCADPRRDDNVLVAHSYGTVISLKLLAHLHSTPEVQEAREADDTAQKEEEDDGPVLYFSKVVLVGAAGERPAGTAHPIWYDTRTVFTLRFVVAAAQPDGQATSVWVGWVGFAGTSPPSCWSGSGQRWGKGSSTRPGTPPQTGA
jgi:hypothetical protein